MGCTILIITTAVILAILTNKILTTTEDLIIHVSIFSLITAYYFYLSPAFGFPKFSIPVLSFIGVYLVAKYLPKLLVYIPGPQQPFIQMIA